MSVSRLVDLQRSTSAVPSASQSPPPSPTDPDRYNFITRTSQIQTKYTEIDSTSARIQSLVESCNAATAISDFRLIYESFSVEVHKANQLIKTVKSQIDALEVSIADFQSKHSGSRESEVDYRKSLWSGLATRLRNSLILFNKAQSSFESAYDRRTAGKGYDFSADAVSANSDADPLVQSVVSKAFAEANAEHTALRKEDLKRLERALTEIRESFLQIAALVDRQGEMIDCIEYSTINAKNYAVEAHAVLIQARKKQKQRTKLWACLGITGIILAAIIAIAIWKIFFPN